MFEVNCEHKSALCTFTYINRITKTIEIVCQDCYTQRSYEKEEDSSSSNECARCKQPCELVLSDSLYLLCETCSRQKYNDDPTSTADTSKYKDHVGWLSKVISNSPSEILPNLLYLGSQFTAQHEEPLTERNITHILVCGRRLPFYFLDKPPLRNGITLRYHCLPIDDIVFQHLIAYLPSAIAFITSAIGKQPSTRPSGAVLVHCAAGVSRSASVIIAYLMQTKRWSYLRTKRFVKEKRKVICPNSRFELELRELWEPQVMLSEGKGGEEDVSSVMTEHSQAVAIKSPLSATAVEDAVTIVMDAPDSDINIINK